MDILPLEEDIILDISNLKFDQLKHEIIKKRRKYFLNDPKQPISINIERESATNTKTNPKAIASIGETCTATIENNIDYLTLEVEQLKK